MKAQQNSPHHPPFQCHPPFQTDSPLPKGTSPPPQTPEPALKIKDEFNSPPLEVAPPTWESPAKVELAAKTAIELAEQGRAAACLKEVTRPSVVGQLVGRWVVGWLVGRLVGVGWWVVCWLVVSLLVGGPRGRRSLWPRREFHVSEGQDM
jgi:hypothetical protein